MRVTLAQTSPKLSRSNLKEIVNIVLSCKDESDLILFGELSLSGYMLQDKLFEDAWNLDELNILKELSQAVDIVVGAAMRDTDGFTNSALYFSRGKLLSRHDKVFLPNYGMFEEARYFKSGDEFKVFTTHFGRVCMAVCEDLWHDQMVKEMAQKNPTHIIALVASPARGFGDNTLEIEDRWYEIIKNSAVACKAKLIFVNRVGFEDGLGFWGGSSVLDESGNFLHVLPRFEKIVKTVKID